jgi:hypothetical protein
MVIMRLKRFLLFVPIVLLLVLPGFSDERVPAPKEILGFEVGADYHLATYEQAIEYFKALDKASDKFKLFPMGESSMGKTMYYAIISSPENMAELERYRLIAAKLALAEVSDEEAKRLAKEGKAVAYIDGGLHASECAPAQQLIQLAYNLVTKNDERTVRILNNVITILVFANPDGMDILADWYHSNVGTPYEVSPLPWLYHIYVGHDNNRDYFMANMVETQNILKLVHHKWFPQILYNHHQTAPFPARIWTPPDAEPTNPNIHPLIIRERNLIGAVMGQTFDEEGEDGAISRTHFDSWYPGYETQGVDTHNVVSILTETALYRYATPHFYTVRDFPENYRDFIISVFYPTPWKGGWWRIKDAVDYCETASLSVLDAAARFRESFLINRYKMGKSVIERFSKEAPYAWIIPEKQWDKPAMNLLLKRLSDVHAIRIWRAKKSFTCDGVSYPAGTYVILMNQPFALFVKAIFEKQEYPDLRKYPELWQGIVRPRKLPGAPLPSYDAAGWTLPLQMGITVVAAANPIKAELEPVDRIPALKSEITGSPGYGYILSHRSNNCFILINRVFKEGGAVYWAKKDFSVGGTKFDTGAIIIPSAGISRGQMDKLASGLGLEIIGVKAKPNVPLMKLAPLRLAMYQPWTASMDEGWTRWLLEQYEFPYTSIHNAEIKADRLKERFDVIIIPGTWRPEMIVDGMPKGTMPPAYVGGIGEDGVMSLKSFVEKGGTLITLQTSSLLPIKMFPLPLRDVLTGISRDKFYCGGSLLRITYDQNHPVAYGMPRETAAMFGYNPAFEVVPVFAKDKAPRVVAKFPGEKLLMSGFLHGEGYLRNKAGVVDVPLGEGRVILLGFGVKERCQPHATFKLLFNSIYYGTVKGK